MSTRTYTTGVPLVVTVNDDGGVVFEVDLSEIDLIDALDDDAGATEADYERASIDQDAVDRVANLVQRSHTFGEDL